MTGVERSKRGCFLTSTFIVKTSNLIITEMFYSHILNMSRGFLHTKSFRRINFPIFRYRSTKITGPKRGLERGAVREVSSLNLVPRAHVSFGQREDTECLGADQKTRGLWERDWSSLRTQRSFSDHVQFSNLDSNRRQQSYHLPKECRK